VTPATAPGEPTDVVATAGPASAFVTWAPPASDGGSRITEYTVTSDPGGIDARSGGATSVTVNGLTVGERYRFRVTATNAVGTSPVSAQSNQVVPFAPPTAPAAPTGVVATAGNGSALVRWSAPLNDGGSPVTGFTVTSSPGGIQAATGGETSVTVTGLTNGVTYTFSVTATNVAGTGPASWPSNAVTPATVPGAPTAVVALAGDESALVSWSPPASGGSPIVEYRVTSIPDGVEATTGEVAATVTGLVNGRAYTFTVTATNAVGAGPPSAPSNEVTPVGPGL
jgi:hypothetical protein